MAELTEKKWLILLGFIIPCIITVGYSLAQDEPVDIQFSVNPCFIGTHICFVGDLVNVNLKLNSNDASLVNKQKEVTISSDGLNNSFNKTIIVNSENNIPIGIALKEGPYRVSVTTNRESVNNLFLKIKHWLLSKQEQDSEIEIKYPQVQVKTTNYKCNNNGFYFEEVELNLEDSLVNNMTCKIRIYTDLLVTTNHPSLSTQKNISDTEHYYENNYAVINKIDQTNEILKVTFLAQPAVQQTNTRIVPVCLINGQDIEIIPQSKKIDKCSVNNN